jgi:hypothetical protein
MKFIKFNGIIMLAAGLAASSAHADDKFTISGFGFQDYRQSNANSYEGADQRGTWKNGILALVMSANASDRDTVWAQLESKPTEPTEFTWAYLDHRFNDNLSARIGRIKMPYGLYNEYIDNKALQVSAIRPSAYSFQADMVHDAFSGIGIDWTLGSLFTQVFGGTIYTPANNRAITDAFSGSDGPYLGLRITWNAPVEGLRFMFSGWDSQTEDNTGIATTPPLGPISKEYRAMYSVEYVSDQLDIKAEHNHHQTPPTAAHLNVTPQIFAAPGVRTNAWYVQGAYKMGLWTPYARFDYFVGDQSIPSDPSSYQKDWVIGVNYKINANVNARIEDHIINGYGLPVTAQDMDPANPGKLNWNMMAAEINFMF